MTSTAADESPGDELPDTIGHLHHAGHVVHDMTAGIALYRRLGFLLPPPAYPMLAPREGAPPAPFGAGNTRVRFARNFVELVTAVGVGPVGDDATLVPLDAPAEALPQLRENIARTAARIHSALARFEGLHILAFQTSDADATAARLAAHGVHHSGVNRLRRPAEPGEGAQAVPVGYVEIDDDSERTPEGRLVVAENPATETDGTSQDHPNGATDLVESTLCVPAAELPAYEHRYAAYLGRPARNAGPARAFDLDRSRVVLVADADLAAILPGEHAPALPAFVAYTVAVRDLAATRSLLGHNGVPVREAGPDALFVPAADAMGAAVVFRSGG